MKYDKDTLEKAIAELDGLLLSYQSSLIPQEMYTCIRYGGIEDGIRESIQVLEDIMNDKVPKYKQELMHNMELEGK